MREAREMAAAANLAEICLRVEKKKGVKISHYI